MAFDKHDYDEVYETTSAPEKTELLGNGWVLLDERFASTGGLADESPSETVARTSLRHLGGWGGWSGAAREQPQPEPPREVTTYVLGWPKGQQTIAEDEAGMHPSGANDAQRTTAGPHAEADTAAHVGEVDLPDVPDAPTAPSPPSGVSESDSRQ